MNTIVSQQDQDMRWLLKRIKLRTQDGKAVRLTVYYQQDEQLSEGKYTTGSYKVQEQVGDGTRIERRIVTCADRDLHSNDGLESYLIERYGLKYEILESSEEGSKAENEARMAKFETDLADYKSRREQTKGRK